jgi:hypothetical protein
MVGVRHHGELIAQGGLVDDHLMGGVMGLRGTVVTAWLIGVVFAHGAIRNAWFQARPAGLKGPR